MLGACGPPLRSALPCVPQDALRLRAGGRFALELGVTRFFATFALSSGPALRMSAGGYFTLDLVAACPYDMLVRVAGGGDRFQAFLRLFKLLRLQRVILWYRRKACSQHSSGCIN